MKFYPGILDTLRQSKIAMGNSPFEDVSPIKNGGFPASYLSLPEGKHQEVSNINGIIQGVFPWIYPRSEGLKVEMLYCHPQLRTSERLHPGGVLGCPAGSDVSMRLLVSWSISPI